MKKLQLQSYLFLGSLLLGSITPMHLMGQANQLTDEIDQYVSQMMDVHEIPGLAIAVIKNGKVINKGYYGNTTLEENRSVSANTIFRLYSLTKLMTTIGIFKLIEERKLSLEDSLSIHFEGLPESWRTVKIKNLLSHSSGLPDVRNYTKELGDHTISDSTFISLLFDDGMDFITDEQWSYNQTNFLLLKLLIEKLTNTSFEAYVLKHQFPNASKEDVLFSSDPFEDISNRAKYYDFDKKTNVYKMKPEFPGKRSHPLNGINITLDEYILWNQGLDGNELINDEMKTLMWSPFDFKKSERKFLHGWDVYEVNDFDSFGFSGGSVSGFRKFVGKDLTVIVLTNGYKYYAIQDIVIDRIAGMVDKSLEDKASILKETILSNYFLSNDTLELGNIYTAVKKENSEADLEGIFKSIGYELFFSLNRKQEAIDLYKLNVMEYPESYDTHGSLAYLQFLTDQFEISRENYVRAQELNPENGYSERMIKKIDAIDNEKPPN